MENWLEIPADRVQLPAGRLCLIMGLTAILVLQAFNPQNAGNRAAEGIGWQETMWRDWAR